ncbi:MAG: sulfatase-like hydrolase/transferase [Cycloclasticus sp.]
MNKLSKLLWVMLIVILVFPIYSLLSVDEVFSNEWRDVVMGNVIFGLVLIWGGKYTLYTFGVMVAFQRILEILVVYVWGAGRFSAGITRQLFLNIQSSTFTENFGYFKQIYPSLFVAGIVIVIYINLYYYACKKVMIGGNKQRHIIYKILKTIIILYLLYFAWNKKVRTDIFFFENNKDQQLTWLNMENKYPFLTKKTDKKIDVYFILGESASKNHLSLYGYKRNTTPYLNSAKNLTVFNDPISPASSTFASYEIMFSRIDKSDKEMFFTPPNMIEELKNMGYYTIWQTYHPLRKSLVFESLADSVDLFLSSDNVGDDRAMISMLKNNLKPQATFYIINMFGSHPYYNVPDDQKHFSKDKNANDKQDTINRFDDTILALDSFVKSVVDMAEQHKQTTHRPYVIWYVSDHGQSIYTNGSDWVGHSANTGDISGYQVPMFIVNKNNLPCGNKLPNPNKQINTGGTYNFILSSLCGK